MMRPMLLQRFIPFTVFVLALAACSGTEGDSSDMTVAQSTSTTQPVATSIGPSVAELATAEWAEFCASEESVISADSWTDDIQLIEAVLAPRGTPSSEDAADLLDLLRTATEMLGGLADAIDEALASQTGVDCGTGVCTVLIAEEGVLVVNFVSGGAGGLDVDEEHAATKQAIGDLTAKAEELGLGDCERLDMFFGEDVAEEDG